MCALSFAISVYHHYRCKFESRSLWGLFDTTLCDKVCQVGGFLRVVWFPPPIKLPTRYNWNIVESGAKHHNPKPINILFLKAISIFLNHQYILLYLILNTPLLTRTYERWFQSVHRSGAQRAKKVPVNLWSAP